MRANYTEICNAFGIGMWEVNPHARSITLDANIASILGLNNRTYSIEIVVDVAQDRVHARSIIERVANNTFDKDYLDIIIKDKLYSAHIVQTTHNDKADGKVVGYVHFTPLISHTAERIDKQEIKDFELSFFKATHINLPIGISLFDKNGKLMDINAKAMAIFGIEDNHNMDELSVFEDPGMPKWFGTNLKYGQMVNATVTYDFDKALLYFPTKRKGLAKINCKGVPIFDKQGTISHYIVVWSDDTESSRVRKMMEDYENLLSMVAGFSKVGYHKWNLLRKTGFTSDQWFANMGCKAGTTIKQLFTENRSVHPDDLHDISNDIEKIIQGQCSSFKREIRIHQQDSDLYRYVIYSAIATKFEPENGSVEIVGMNIDITEIKEMDIKLAEATNQASQLITQKELVSSNLNSTVIYVDTDYVVRWQTSNANFMKRGNGYVPGQKCYKTAFDRDTPCEDCVLTKMIESQNKVSTEEILNEECIEITANPVFGNSSELIGGVIKIENITLQKNNEKTIRKLNTLMGAILEYVPVSLFVKDTNDEMRYLYWNKAMSELTLIPKDVAIGRSDFEIFPSAADAERFRNDDIKLLESEGVVEFDESVLDAKGQTKYVHTVKTLIPTDSGRPWLLGVSWDITELKKIQFDLIKAKEKAEDSDRLKSSFIANMSHEIRTPLNAIVGFSELLSDPTIDNDERTEYLSIIQRNNQLLLQLISDILDLSKIEANMLEFNSEKTNLNLLCTQVATLCSKKLGAKVPIVFDKNTPHYVVLSDENRIQQILSNFITNAIKFTPTGHIEIGIEPISDNELKIYVKDTGIGICQDQTESIFDRFVKLDSYVQGTGLGLSISKHLAERLGGRIGVESKLGEGSKFWFTLPYDKNI